MEYLISLSWLIPTHFECFFYTSSYTYKHMAHVVQVESANVFLCNDGWPMERFGNRLNSIQLKYISRQLINDFVALAPKKNF